MLRFRANDTLSLLEGILTLGLAKCLSIELLVQVLQKSPHCSTVSVEIPPFSSLSLSNTVHHWELSVVLSPVMKTELPPQSSASS